MPTKNFPGVYSSIIDRSALAPVVSRFQAGLIGVASKGPFNTPTRVRSIRDFQNAFGKPLTTTFTDTTKPKNPDGAGYYLADAVAVVSAISDGLTVVRVGAQYTAVTSAAASGTSGASTILTASQAQIPADAYIRVREAGKPSTVNAQVLSRSGNVLTLDTTLKASYTSATVDVSTQEEAASQAESFLYGYNYASVISTGTVGAGSKNAFSFTYTGGSGDIAAGDLLKITSSTRATTEEIRVKKVVATSPLTVELETSNVTEIGYQAVALQDSYPADETASIRKVSTSTKSTAWALRALTAGTWANGSDSKTGLYVGVRPGSKAGTKRLEVYENGALVETFDNLSTTAGVDFYETRINDVSQYFTITNLVSPAVHPANTAAPWNAVYQAANYTGDEPLVRKGLPHGAINNGQSVTAGSHGSFDLGFDGLSTTDSDFIGTVLDDGTLTGIKAFEDVANIQVDVIAAPMDEITPAIAQELGRVAKAVNAVALVDVPSGLNLRSATDWHNGVGQYSDNGKLDTANVAFVWNWFQTTDRFSSTPSSSLKWVPPTIGALRCMAYTFDTGSPYRAAAGETYGLIPEALQVEFPRVSEEDKEASYGEGNSINPILLNRGRIMLFGDRTAQRTETKLTALHSVVLVNIIVKGMATIARRYVFDPNDSTLLLNLRSELRDFLGKISNERGIEQYSLVMDSSNNTADTRNRREVRVDLSVIPVDATERIYINATVRESGAQLVQ